WYTSMRPSIYRESSFWTTSPTWFAIRVGILMIGLAALYAVSRGVARFGFEGRALSRFGRGSLFVDWIHVELVYGYATAALHGKLSLAGAVAAFAAFTVVMYGALSLKDALVELWRARKTLAGFSFYSPFAP